MKASAKSTLLATALLLVAGCAATGNGTASDSADHGAAGNSDSVVLARIGDRVITEDDLKGATPVLHAEIRRKHYELVEAQENAAKQFIVNEMILAEAAERGMTDQEIFQAEVDAVVPMPSEEEIQGFYDANQQYARGRSLDDVRTSIVREIRRPQLARAQARFLRQLREKYDARTVIEPIRIAYDLPPTVKTRGSDSAPITLVEFADYQCPSCKGAHPIVEQLLTEYGDQIRYVFVDFPLANHSRAIPASVAARCADEQDRFWDFSDNLMVMAGDLADTDLYSRADSIGLDSEAFATCYGSNQQEPVIQSHLSWGQSLGINATPSFLINDRLLIGSKPIEQMKQLIEKEIERAG